MNEQTLQELEQVVEQLKERVAQARAEKPEEEPEEDVVVVVFNYADGEGEVALEMPRSLAVNYFDFFNRLAE